MNSDNAFPAQVSGFGVAARTLVIFILLVSSTCLSSCAEEVVATEPEGAYIIWRQALFDGDEDKVYDQLDDQTQKVFQDRVVLLGRMSQDIQRYLPQADQKLARQQTGVVMLSEHGIKDGRGLFKALIELDKLTVSPELEVGTEVSEVEVNESGTEAAVVVYAGQQFVLRKEEDAHWRIASWRQLSTERTQWILDNGLVLEQTVQDLINEEKEEVNAVIKYLLEEDKRSSAQKADQKK